MTINQIGTEACRQVVAAALHQHQTQVRVSPAQVIYCLKITRDVIANRRVRATSSLKSNDTVGGQGVLAGKELGILTREDIVGDYTYTDLRPQSLAQPQDQGGFPCAYGPAHANAQ
jgi:hypothetical protein